MRSEYIYYLFIALTELGYGATMTLYAPLMAALGLGYEEIAWLNIVFHVTMVALEIPTGVIADRYGRATSVTVGTFLLSIGGFCYTYVLDFWTVMATELVCGLGFCCISGALSAWVIDARDRKAEMRVVLANGTGIRTVGFLSGNMAGVYLAPDYGEQIGFTIMGVLVALACLLTFLFMRPRDCVANARGKEEVNEMRQVLRRLKETPSLCWALAMTAVMGSMVNFNLYWVLFMRSRLSLPELGWMSSLILVSVGVASWIVRSEVGGCLKNGHGHFAGIAVACVTLSCFSVEQSTGTWAWLLVVHEIGRGVYQLCNELFVHERIEERYRATFGSVTAFVAAAGCGLTLLVTSAVFYGRDPDPTTIPGLWFGTSVVCLAGTAVLWRFRPR